VKTSPQPIFDNLDYWSDPFLNPQALTAGLSLKPEQRWDLAHSAKFLFSYNGSTATFNSYRREIERLLQWTWTVRGTQLSKLRREDIEAFLQFCMDPPPSWTGTKQCARFRNKNGAREANPDWRPFVINQKKNQPQVTEHNLSQKALQAIFAILSSFFNYLIQEEYCSSNPVALIRQKSKFLQKSQNREQIRRISNFQWDYVLAVAEQLADEDPEHERTLFIFNCLLGMYLRISELVADERSTPLMGDFRVDHDHNWWFHVVGKGNKSRMITVSDAMLNALKRYRRSLGLTALPYPGEQLPLISKVLGTGPVTSTRQIRYLVQSVFDRAFEKMRVEGLEDEATELRIATVHWLRHTGISEDVKLRPREHVKEDAGHSSMATTDKYIDSELRERHASGRNKKIKREAHE
jgi:site-specific recombinase XerD